MHSVSENYTSTFPGVAKNGSETPWAIRTIRPSITTADNVIISQCSGLYTEIVMVHNIRHSVKPIAHLFPVFTSSSVSDTLVVSSELSSSSTLLLRLMDRLREVVATLSSDTSLHPSISLVVKAILSLLLKELAI